MEEMNTKLQEENREFDEAISAAQLEIVRLRNLVNCHETSILVSTGIGKYLLEFILRAAILQLHFARAIIGWKGSKRESLGYLWRSATGVRAEYGAEAWSGGKTKWIAKQFGSASFQDPFYYRFTGASKWNKVA